MEREKLPVLRTLLENSFLQKAKTSVKERLIRLENLSTGKAYGLETPVETLPASAVVDGNLVRLESSSGYIAGCWEGGRLTRVTSWLWNSIFPHDFKAVLESQLRERLTR